MNVRLARLDEAEALWTIRNQAIRYGCRESYASEVIAAWTPEAMPENYRCAVVNNPFYVIEDPISRKAVAKMKIACQLELIRFTGEPAIAFSLFSGQKIDGHTSLPA